VILKEAQASYTLSLDSATLGQETVVLEREGRPVVVVVPFAEYQVFADWRRRWGKKFWREQEEWEWAELSPWEQEGMWPDELTPEMIEARVQAVLSLRGIIRIDDPDEALYVATSPELAPENVVFSLDDDTDVSK
jgi:hypothetical protein